MNDIFYTKFKSKLLESVSEFLNEADSNLFDKDDEQNIAQMLVMMANEINMDVPEQVKNIADAKEESLQENKIFDILKSFAKKVLLAFLLSLTLFNPSANAMNVPSQVSLQNGIIKGIYNSDTKEYTTKECNNAANELTLKWEGVPFEKIDLKDFNKLNKCQLNPVQVSFLQTELDSNEYSDSKYMDITISVVKDAETGKLTDQFSVDIGTLSHKTSVTLENGSSQEAYNLLCDKVLGFKDHVSYDKFMQMIKNMNSTELQDLVNLKLTTKEKK